MLTCPSCGKSLKNGELICPVCGKDIELVSEFPVESLLDTKGTLGYEKKPDKTSSRYQKIIARNREKQEKRKQQRLVIFIAIVIMALTAGVVFGVRYYTKYRQSNDYNYQFSHARSSYTAGDKAAAYVYIRQALALNPDSEAANIFYAGILADDGRNEEAEKLYLAVIERNAGSTEAYQALLNLYEDEGRSSDMKKLILGGNDTIRKYFSSYIPEAPVILIPEGDYDELIDVAIRVSDNEKVYYTLDGSTPDRTSTLYTGSISLKEGRNEIRAIAYNDYGISGKVTIAVYNITLAAPEAAVISPKSGKYDAGTEITVTVPENCTAYYCFDGTPDDTCSRVTGAVKMQEGTHIFSVIVKNKAGKYSSVASETYVVGGTSQTQ